MITKMARINFPLPDEVHERAKIAAFMSKITLRQFIRDAVAEKLQRFQEERGVDLAAMAEARQSGEIEHETANGDS
jgi:hypothetical protein